MNNKKIHTVCSLIFTFLFAGLNIFEYSFVHTLEAQNLHLMARGKIFPTQNSLDTLETLPPPLPGDKYDIVFMKLELELDPSIHYVKGKAKIYIIPKEDSDSISLQLHDSLQVEYVNFHGNFLNYSRPGIHALVS